MKTKVLATLGAAVLAMGASVTASQAQIISQPGETMGVALGAPLPEGVFFVDLENYGKKDGGGAVNAHLGVNIPVVAWSTPFSFYDTRLEFLYAAPFTHIDGAGGALNRTDVYSQALLAIFAHSFGNGFNAAVILGPRTPDNFTNAGRGVGADGRLSLAYVNNGLKAVATFAYSGNFGGKQFPGPAGGGFNDNVYVDYTLTKTFGKVEIGIVGYAQTDLKQVFGATYGRSLAVGGLLGYDFGKVTAQAMVTREVASNGVGYGLPGRYDTRGWLRLIVPLYVAPAAPVVAARY